MSSSQSTNMEDCQLEPIAVIGMACRLPGSIDGPSKFWDMLREQRSVQTHKVPSSRFNIDAHYHPDLARPGSFKSLGGYFLDGSPEDFDPTFFNMTPVEAMWLDPQQRKMLEVTYECLESAGLSLESVSDTNTAVYVGSFTTDYQQMSILEPDFRHNYAATGVDVGIISNRIGNAFNLNGPSFTINTACSSSVYAIHNACHALRAGDCCAAIVGGVNLVLTVDQHMNTAKLGVLSPTSTCHTFDASADGYGRAEGAGALYLKKLSHAIRDGDVIRGVIRSSAANTNGKVDGMGITYPSVKGQERVVRQAYARARLDPSKTAYAECHGTGTPVGDPIEARAISRALNDTRNPEKPLILGAVKANIGHSEAASGIFAAMKVAMVIENSVIPGVCGLKNLNPAINTDEWNIKINQESLHWPEEFTTRRASLSSFGYGGTNAHLIMENIEALCPWYEHGKSKATAQYSYDVKRPFLVTMSAHDKTTLLRNIDAHSRVASDYHIPDLAYTLNERRSKFKERGFTIMSEDQTSSFVQESFKFGSVVGKPVKLGFVFTGQGAQWPRMGYEAMQTFPSFSQTINALDEVLQRVAKPEWTLREVLEASEDNSRIGEAEISQPVCTAIQIAIVDLFSSWGIKPEVTIGHSSGEIGAAYAAGRLSAPEAIAAAYFRGLAVKTAAGSGTMLAVGVGASEVRQYIPESIAGAVTIACENAPNSVTLSGSFDDIKETKKFLDQAGVFARELRTGKAYHSPHMNAVAPLYRELYSNAAVMLTEKDLSWRCTQSDMVSSVTAAEYVDPEISISYWCDNLRGRVLFDPAMKILGSSEKFANITTLVEIGPHSALGGPIKSICSTNGFSHLSYCASLVRKVDSAHALLSTAGQLHNQGLKLNWKAVNGLPGNINPRYVPDLPAYQWNYERKFWFEPRVSAENRRRKYMRHDILGSRISGLSSNAPTWKNVLRQGDVPWLKDHKLGGAVVFPGAGHFSLAIEAYMQICGITPEELDSISLRDVKIKTALIVPDNDEGIEIHTRLIKPSDEAGLYKFTVESVSGDIWTTHTEGFITKASRQNAAKWPHDIKALHRKTQSKRWYESFNRVGFAYGPSFQTIGPLRSNGRERATAASVRIQKESNLMVEESRYVLHPSTIDGCLHAVIASIHKGDHKHMPWGVVPLDLEELNINLPSVEDRGTFGDCLAWTDRAFDGRYFNTNTSLQGPSGQTVMEIKNLKVVVYDAAIPQTNAAMVPPMPYSKSTWLPDVLTLSQDQAEDILNGLSKAQSCAKLIELIRHKQGLSQVLLLTEVNDASLVSALQAALPKSSKLFIITSVDDTEIEVNSEGAQVNFSKSDVQEALESQPELVILHESIKPDSATAKAVANFSYSDEGLLILALQPENSLQAYQDIGYPEPFLYGIPNDNSAIHVSLIRLSDERADSAVAQIDNVAIITDGEMDILTSCLFSKLGIENRCEHIEFPSTIDVTKYDQFIISDCSNTLLSDPSEATFANIKQVLTSGKRIIWLTQGVNEGRSISGGIATGFLRAIRNELIASDITLCDVHSEFSHDECVSFVARQLQANSKSGDNEFWLGEDNKAYVPRLVSNEKLSSLMSTADTFDESTADSNNHSQLQLRSDSAYLLVGCLGGLGRSLTTYMLERGCKHFVFLSRSGADKPEAAAVVENLQKAGASVEVYRADASDFQAVQRAVDDVSTRRTIHGVVHAAMVLEDGMFESMSVDKYKAVLNPKMLGAMNLHNALKGTTLDFFVMTSSISAVLGNPGQSSYCAGNSFLDSLALHRRRNGLAASSVALPMVLDVGVVAENPEIEDSLNRKGLYGIDENEMLNALDAGMRQGPPEAGETIDIGKAQILLGLEPAALATAMSSADETDVYWTADTRLTGVLAEVSSLTSGGASKNLNSGFAIDLDGTSEAEAIKIIGTHIMERCGRILMLPIETFDMQQHSVASYGVDSMIGVELRTWLFKEFGLEIGFQSLLNPKTTFGSLSQVVIEHLKQAK